MFSWLDSLAIADRPSAVLLLPRLRRKCSGSFQYSSCFRKGIRGAACREKRSAACQTPAPDCFELGSIPSPLIVPAVSRLLAKPMHTVLRHLQNLEIDLVGNCSELITTKNSCNLLDRHSIGWNGVPDDEDLPGSSASLSCFLLSPADDADSCDCIPKIGPGGKNGKRVPVATERKPRAMASSVACCLFKAT